MATRLVTYVTVKVIVFVVISSLMLNPQSAETYELGTHARITREAASATLTADGLVTADLGLTSGSNTNLGGLYFDLRRSSDQPAITRQVFNFDWLDSVMPGVRARNDRSINSSPTKDVVAWMMRGAIREDDGNKLLKPSNPHDVDNFNRFCNHFYDPKFNVKMSFALCTGDDLTSSPAWAAGVSAALGGAIARPFQLFPRDESRKNHYALPDAREAMWRALTLKQFRGPTGALLADASPDGAGLILRELPPPTDYLGLDTFESPGRAGFSGSAVNARRQYRDAYWATTFFALGSILHLNQDMAQPQHTRIETHPFGPRGDYERYAEMRAKSDEVPDTFQSFLAGLLTPITARPLVYSNPAATTVPAFANFSDYWSTARDGGVATGLGLGDHSNSRFFSPGHNLGQGYYALPSNTPAQYVGVEVADSSGDKHRYLADRVKDPLSDANTTILMTRLTPSAEARAEQGWASSQRVGNKLDYMLDTRVYDDYLGQLVPLAVRYSTGLLNHFFRGRMTISAPDQEVYGVVDHAVEYTQYQGHGFSKLKAKLANTSATEEILAGYIVAIGKFHRNTCYRSDFSDPKPRNGSEAVSCRSPEEEITVSKPISIAGLGRSPTQFTFEFPIKLPINATDVRLQVVFRGQLGNEPDVVIAAGKDLYEPTFVSIQNDADYVAIGQNVYTEQGLIKADMDTLLRIAGGCVAFLGNTPIIIKTAWCFDFERVMDWGFHVGSGTTTVTVEGLPVGQYSRFAYIADSEITKLSKASGNCSSYYAYDVVTNVKFQSDVLDSASGSSQLIYPSFTPSRGVGGWFALGCVQSGDRKRWETDKRWTQMTPLPDDLKPTPLTQIVF